MLFLLNGGVVCFCCFQLIKECKEILEAATNIKLYYLQMVGAVIPQGDVDNIDLEMDQFDDDMEKMLDVGV